MLGWREVAERTFRSVEFRDCVSRISVFLVWPSQCYPSEPGFELLCYRVSIQNNPTESGLGTRSAFHFVDRTEQRTYSV